MLKKLKLKGVGPADELEIDFSPRMNFLTGDNGLGKSFILDIAWWSLTRCWARGIMAVPQKNAAKAEICCLYDGAKSDISKNYDFNFQLQQWSRGQGRPSIPGVVIYAGVDGSFSVWDPARNYWNSDQQNQDISNSTRPSCFDFKPEEVWNGLKAADAKTQLCNGLLNDWVLWQASQKPAFEQLKRVLEILSPSENEIITPAEPMRIGESVQELPALRMPYGQDVALTHASAAIRRICSLAYLLVWTWHEHNLACERYRVNPAREIVFLIDEIECHLHPQWQRRIVPALLNVMQGLTGTRDVPLQLIVATHSPLVLASVEPEFDAKRDCVRDFDLVDNRVEVNSIKWTRKGDVNAWLSSDVFNLKQPSSKRECLSDGRSC